jgi:hypothetical protein
VTILRDHPSAFNPKVEDHFDKVGIRMDRDLTKAELQVLAANAESVNSRLGRAIRGSKADWLITVVIARRGRKKERILRVLAGLPEGAFVNYVEPARNVLMPDAASAHALTWLAARTFVRPRHGKHQMLFGVQF